MAVTVSILMVTYNHEHYIAQAIESVMMQQANFNYQLVIGEDCSPDATRAICEKYSRQYPDKIKLLPSNKNLGMMKNFLRVYDACDGEYIAILDGDDYWTDPLKLQRQVDFLQQHNEVLLCGHYVDELQEADKTLHKISEGIKLQQSFSDFATIGCNGVYTCSMLFRNIDLFRSYFNKDGTLLDGADHLLLLLATLNNRQVYILPESMGVYRKHGTGVWNSSNPVKKATGGLLNNYLYKKNLPIRAEERKYFDWNDRRHFTQIIYAQKRPLPGFLNRIVNKALSTIPSLVGMKLYSSLLHPAYCKLYKIQFDDKY